MIKRFFYVIVCVCAFLIGMCAPVRAAVQPGQQCSTAIHLDSGYVATINGSFPKTVWYTAGTFDLPLSVYFIPSNPSDPKPLVEMDFKCPLEPYYKDSIICSLFCPNSGSGVQIEMPHKPSLKNGQTEDGRFCYYLAIGKEYRDLLLKTGIDYNVDVYIKVTYQSAGTISIAPDDMFTNCMSAKFMHLGDAVSVKPLDDTTHVVVPYVQWQEDSIRYIWNGTAPVTLAVGFDCDFDPTDNGDPHILDYVPLEAQDTLKLTSSELKYYVHNEDVTSEAGMFFAKFYTEGTGTMKIERVPQDPPEGNATLLRYDRVISIPSDTDKLYAISFTWDTATIFTTPTDHIFKMYIGTTHDFYLEDAIASYQFHATDTSHWLGLSTEQMRALWTQATSQYLYIRFQCTAKTTLKSEIWQMSECFINPKVKGEIKRPSTTLNVEKGSYGAAYYRLYYRDWEGGDMTFQWQTNQSTCPTYIGKNCSFSEDSDDVLRSKNIPRNGTWTIRATGSTVSVDTWANYVDEDGYLYVRFSPDEAGEMTISTTAPEEEDPAPIVYPAATIFVQCAGEPTATGQQFSVQVSEEQDLHIEGGEQWHQSPNETHSLTLSTGVYTLVGAEQSVQIKVK